MRTLVLVVLLALWPGVAGAAERRPNALEAGAGVATCMTALRRYDPPEEGVSLRGNVHRAILIEDGVDFAVIEPDATELWMNVTSLTIPAANEHDELYAREQMRYAITCLGNMRNSHLP